MYQKIEVKIWRDEKFLDLSEDGRWLFFYFLTSPHSNSIGLYVLPKGYIVEDLQWSLERLDKPFAELLDKHLVEYDKTVRVIFVKNQLKHRPLVNQNQVIGAQKTLESLPQTPLFAGLRERLDKPLYKPLMELLDKLLPKLNSKPIAITKDINININTNPKSKAVPSKKEDPMTKMSYPQNKNGVSEDIKNIVKNFKPYDEKIKIVDSHYESLSPDEKRKFYLGALAQKSFGAPKPNRGSFEEKQLMILWYDKSVEKKSPRNQNARQAENGKRT